MTILLRLRLAALASSFHLLASVGVALLAAGLVFGLWYPFPYRELSGGRELFLLVVSVDVVCGPLLTLVLFSPAKPRAELWRDLGLVALIQLGALGYGIHTVWIARPLFLVLEVDRFKVVTSPYLDSSSFSQLPTSIRPGWLKGPILVALRAPKDNKEREKVLFESVNGGPDYAERPEFYVPYDSASAVKSMQRARPLDTFLRKEPSQLGVAASLAAEKGESIEKWLYMPVVARRPWVAILDSKTQIQGFLPGDGF